MMFDTEARTTERLARFFYQLVVETGMFSISERTPLAMLEIEEEEDLVLLPTPSQPVITEKIPEINHSLQDFQEVETRQQTLERENESKDAWLKQVQADALLSYSLRREAIANDDGIFWN